MSDIIEAAARALRERWLWLTKSDPETDRPSDEWLADAEVAVRAVAPLIRAATLEEAAKVAEDFIAANGRPTAYNDPIAAAIRALKEQP